MGTSGYCFMASGGSLKPEKCYWYWMAFNFKFRHGKAIYKLSSELPHRQLLIPTREGGEAPITLKGPHESSNNLGILQCPSGCPKAHLEKMTKNGLDCWADRASTSSLLRYISRIISHDFQLVYLK